MILVNRKWPKLEELLKDYTKWYSLRDNYEREQWEVDHNYERFGKIHVIKRIREIAALGLREAKDLTEIFEKPDSSELWLKSLGSPSHGNRKLLESAGFSFETRFQKNKSRMLRVRDSLPLEEISCEHTLGKEVEWRVVGEYEIHIAKYCPECGAEI